MFIKKIEIVGFKSFANKTMLDFSTGGILNAGNIGITAIVGPNGSGKSNIADALKWVLGEQSMKTLRGKKSQDIIFAGSGKKTQLGSAQVSIFFDNSDKKIPIDYEEVVITRKIFRSGESEYLINSSKVRLVDVIYLLAKAGIGQRSYCIINQGMADQVLNSTPIERRGMIEEAAGVREFQVKKERSERKLRSTKTNLERVGGLLVEIEPHLKMLKRQSQKAEKGQYYKDKLAELQNQLFGFLWSKFEKSKNDAQFQEDSISRDLQLTQRKVDDFKERLLKESKSANKTKDEVAAFEKDLRELNFKLNNLEREIIIEEGKLALEKERAKNIQEVEVIPVNADLIKKRLSEINSKQNELIGRISEIKKIEQLDQLREYAKSISKQLDELYEGILKGRMEKRKPQKEIDGQKTINLKNVHVIMEKLAQLKKQKIAQEKEASLVKSKIESLIEKDKKERREAIEVEDSLRRGQFELDKLKDKHNEVKIELAKIQVREEDLVGRIRQELKISPAELKYKGEKVEPYKHEQEIDRLKGQLLQIGGIDRSILEEYEETKNRFEFLEQESADLHDAMKRLREVIREMDKKIKEKFEDTFKLISKEFSNYFKIIFSGGKAGLDMIKISQQRFPKLETEGNPEQEGEMTNENEEEKNIQQDETEEAQYGIEISACPPGKKINNLGMLSGGERSLTSIALLFAIISHNPPPFAILDEIEAALDEANSKRFSKILHELSDKTQFVLVTHNRQTMKEASLLYGVTMGEDGVSKLLSVRLDQIGNKGEIKQAA